MVTSRTKHPLFHRQFCGVVFAIPMLVGQFFLWFIWENHWTIQTFWFASFLQEVCLNCRVSALDSPEIVSTQSYGSIWCSFQNGQILQYGCLFCRSRFLHDWCLDPKNVVLIPRIYLQWILDYDGNCWIEIECHLLLQVLLEIVPCIEANFAVSDEWINNSEL